MRLGTLLLRDAVITLTQLEQALRAQVLNGGRLGTNLVEQGYIDLNILGRYLARSTELPLAIADRFEKANPELVEKLGPHLADKHSALPLDYEKDDASRVAVVLRDPFNKEDIFAVQEALGHEVVPYIAAELRLYYYLERYYGIRRRARYSRASENTQPPPSRRERRSTQPFIGFSAPTRVTVVPKSLREKSMPMVTRPLRSEVTDYAASSEALKEAKHRIDIAQALLRYTIGRFECAALFMVRKRNAIGWLAQAMGLGKDALERLHLPLNGSSVLQAAHDSQQPFRGRALSVGHPVEGELWSRFAIDHHPDDLHVIPIVVAGSIVNLVYAHSAPGHRVSDNTADELVLLCSEAAAAYQRLIEENVKE